MKAIASSAYKAFTLIELLVVIAIIAILSAILFPVFGRARENARRASCQSNLKQTSLSIIQYRQDYDELFPSATGLGPETGGWGAAIQPYVKNLQIHQCPSEKTPSSSVVAADGPGSYYTADNGIGSYTDYWYNAALSWNNSVTAPEYRIGINEAAVLNPTLTVMCGDGGAINHGLAYGTARFRCTGAGADGRGGLQYDKPTVGSGPGLATDVAQGRGRHLEGMNVSFVDGHVKWLNVGVSARGNIYNMRTGANTSGNNPTFNAVNQNNR